MEFMLSYVAVRNHYLNIIVLYLGYLKSANVKKIFYFISLLSIICIQLKMPLPIITQYLLKKNMNEEKFINAKEVLLEKKYFKFIKIIANQKNYLKKEENYIVRIEKTFDGYYKFKEYDFINILEAPNNETISKVSIELGSRGTIQFITLAAMPIEDLETSLATD